jgi:hypothetical protein
MSLMSMSEMLARVSKVSDGRLDLSARGLTDEKVFRLAEVLQNKPGITVLDLHTNIFGDAAAAAVLTLPHIVKLSLSDNNLSNVIIIGNAKIKGFVDFLREGGQSKLTTLRVSQNSLTDKSVYYLLQAKLGPDPVLARKIAEIRFFLFPNEEISDESLNEFYNKSPGYKWVRRCSDEFAALNKATYVYVPSYHPFLSSITRTRVQEDSMERQSKMRRLTEEQELSSVPSSALTPALS